MQSRNIAAGSQNVVSCVSRSLGETSTVPLFACLRGVWRKEERRRSRCAPLLARPRQRTCLAKAASLRRYLLDTNIISNVTKPAPSASLLVWMAAQRDEDLFISALTLAEIWRGVLAMPVGRKRNRLEVWLGGPEGPSTLFAGRVLSFDEKAGLAWAKLMAEGAAKGRPRSALEMIVAAIAQANSCVVVTDNERDFVDVAMINPLRSGLVDR